MSQSAPPPAPFSHPVRPADLPQGRPYEVVLIPEAAALAAIAADLGLDGLRKMRLTGQLAPFGKRDWRFTGQLGATVVQPCVVTLAPVTTRLEEPVSRIWRADLTTDATATEVEMPDETDEEPLGEVIDLGLMALEALALAVPLYPHAEGARLAQKDFTAPGKEAMTDEQAKPFAGLAALKAAMESDAEPGDDG